MEGDSTFRPRDLGASRRRTPCYPRPHGGAVPPSSPDDLPSRPALHPLLRPPRRDRAQLPGPALRRRPRRAAAWTSACDQAYLLAKQIQRHGPRASASSPDRLARAHAPDRLIISGVLGNVAGRGRAAAERAPPRRVEQPPDRARPKSAQAASETPPGGESEDAVPERRGARAGARCARCLDRRPLLVSSKGVGRILNDLLGGEGRMQVGNGEIVEFDVRRDVLGARLADRREPAAPGLARPAASAFPTSRSPRTGIRRPSSSRSGACSTVHSCSAVRVPAQPVVDEPVLVAVREHRRVAGVGHVHHGHASGSASCA